MQPELDFSLPPGWQLPALPEQKGEHLAWGGLRDASLGLAMAEAALVAKGLVLIVAEDAASAEILEGELRFFLDGRLPVRHFPDWEILPYDFFSPHEDIISDRLSILFDLAARPRGVIIVPARTIMHRLPPRAFIRGSGLAVRVGQTLDLDRMIQDLTDNAYRRVETVREHGDFAVRGSILDIFPTGSDLPFRIDLFDDEVNSLRTFDPEDQRSVERIDAVDLLPAREFPFTSSAIGQFLDRWHIVFGPSHRDPRLCSVYQDISNQLTPAGIEYYLPLFFEQMETLFDYLPPDTLLLSPPGLRAAAKTFAAEVASRHENLRHDPERPILPPEELFLGTEELLAACAELPGILLTAGRKGEQLWPAAKLPEVTLQDRSPNPLQSLAELLSGKSPPGTLICAESNGRREVITELLRTAGLPVTEYASWTAFLAKPAQLGITVAPLTRGLYFKKSRLLLLSEPDLFGDHVLQERRRSSKPGPAAELAVRNLAELSIGSPVVHLDHGVGRYLGLQSLTLDATPAEFLTLLYQDEARLYVPVSSLHLISRWSGAEDEKAPLHRLGSDTWEKAKRKAAEKVRDVAAELLDIYARRQARPGRSFRLDEADYARFCRAFPFEETPDQLSAIEAVLKDMLAPKAMDRLICGDVGFGKTEVAMRAAFAAVQSGTQVAVLVPTTLLAQQHFETFRDRFADWPVNIHVISRFRTKKEQQESFAQLAGGQVDIVVGTHVLLNTGIQFKELGLLIIDEEHRFGVRQKEQLKSLRAEVDILTLTATPIPRTLNLSLAGMRDLSIIATPPLRRLSIKTFVRESRDGLIREAIQREVQRGGQVYYLHNEVRTIKGTLAKLEELVPKARIAVAHGQMRERELEKVMSDFYHKRSNVLLCTTIIETGIDIPSANTIIIERADKFGLAQIHQLRGRVGRSHHQAYAWLLTPHPDGLTRDAKKRLDAIVDAEELGSGYLLATHDLEIRGAGELLGDEQSGQLQTIGFTLYMEMLDRAVESIRQGQGPNLEKPLRDGTEVNLHLPALIPEDYLPDVHSRLLLYKRIAHAPDARALMDLQGEMADRFGGLPEAAKNLFRVTEVKIRAEALGIKKLDIGETGGRLDFSDETLVDPSAIVQLVQEHPKGYAFANPNRLRVQKSHAKPAERIKQALDLLELLHRDKTETAAC